MSKTLSIEDVFELAKLSRISLSREEAEAMVSDLEGVLAHMQDLAAIDTSEVSALTHIHNYSDSSSLRSDESAASLSVEEATAASPKVSQNMFWVPATLPSK